MDQIYKNILYTLESILNDPQTSKNNIGDDFRTFWRGAKIFFFPRATTGKFCPKKAFFEYFGLKNRGFGQKWVKNGQNV